ncbi:hypothetical protein [Nocardioides sp. TF02-7]|uniref:hypothetical protein n=1 Tax=Nocardioides sp. TF02-7 TaxID=2917724 RepID=UPI001F0662AE|nr:hypothetical protein [Nocardioides sp. TF02-7]UMG92128.1 hypothetical protein MF408_19615 [Nocardioides sp. TF02-7]
MCTPGRRARGATVMVATDMPGTSPSATSEPLPSEVEPARSTTVPSGAAAPDPKTTARTVVRAP